MGGVLVPVGAGSEHLPWRPHIGCIELVESPIQEQKSFWDLYKGLVRYLYERTRVQFHPALYVLVYAVTLIAMLQAALFVISLIPGFGMVIDYELVGMFTGLMGIGELVRGHVKYWLGYTVEDWCYPAMVAGGIALGGTFAGLIYLMWGMRSWHEPVGFVLMGVGFYVVCGWALQMMVKAEAKKKAPERKDSVGPFDITFLDLPADSEGSPERYRDHFLNFDRHAWRQGGGGSFVYIDDDASRWSIVAETLGKDLGIACLYSGGGKEFVTVAHRSKLDRFIEEDNIYLPEGSFLSPDKAWLAVEDFLRDPKKRSSRVEWIETSELTWPEM